MATTVTGPTNLEVTDPTSIRIRYRYSDIDGHEWFVEPAASSGPGGATGHETLGAGTGYHMEDAIRRARKWVAENCDCDPKRVPVARP